jgi:basic membrane lipoprotein Med (substrate-binding protein (PBP1-ABC) superfamily)
MSAEYKEALKLGQKEYRACISKGVYPYLPVMDDFISPERYATGIDLGLQQIPVEFVVGTRSKGRKDAFARNFMPLMGVSTEFADKWSRLCQSHLEEGIREPIRVYEYLNRYYVEEGNKRVSVLKYFGAVNVMARVIRIMPLQVDTPEGKIYLEQIDFYKYSQVNYVEFSKPGSYAQLQELVGKAPGESWTPEEQADFSSVYYYFCKAYRAKGGDRLSTTPGDALLAYLTVYSYQDLCGKGLEEIKQTVGKVWEEITLQQEQPSIDVKLHPAEEKKHGILTKRRSGTAVEKIAFIHDKTPTTSGWTYGHELGRCHVEMVFAGKVKTEAYYDSMDGDPAQTIEEAIRDGNTILFTTSPRLLTASLRAAVEHPEVTILNCSLNKSHRYIRTYEARMYEVKYIIGAIAGSLAGDHDIGYICNYPIFGQVAGINAFALGVQLVNPRAKVYLEWSSIGGEEAATRRLLDRGIHLISSQNLAKLEDMGRSNLGLSWMTEDSLTNLAVPVWNWGLYYEAMIRRIQSRALQTEYEESSKALNYYWGLSAGAVDVYVSEQLPDGVKHLAEYLKRGITTGLCNPFQGPLYSQQGERMVQEHSILTMEQIITMDWLVSTIEGRIPAYEELSDTGKATVDMVGVERLIRSKQSAQADSSADGGDGS